MYICIVHWQCIYIYNKFLRIAEKNNSKFFLTIMNFKTSNFQLGFPWEKSSYWEMLNMVGGQLPRGYPFCRDNSSWSFQDRKFFNSQINWKYQYIRDVHITWILIVGNLCKKYQLLIFVIFFFAKYCIYYSVPDFSG